MIRNATKVVYAKMNNDLFNSKPVVENKVSSLKGVITYG